MAYYPRLAGLEGALDAERRQFNAGLVSIETRKSQLGAQVTHSRNEIDDLQARLAATQDQLKLTSDELNAVLPLWEKGLVSIDRLSQLRRTKAALTRTIGQTRTSWMCSIRRLWWGANDHKVTQRRLWRTDYSERPGQMLMVVRYDATL